MDKNVKLRATCQGAQHSSDREFLESGIKALNRCFSFQSPPDMQNRDKLEVIVRYLEPSGSDRTIEVVPFKGNRIGSVTDKGRGGRIESVYFNSGNEYGDGLFVKIKERNNLYKLIIRSRSSL